MATEVILPRVDMDMTEGKIAHWYVRNGDPVTKGQVIFEIETDKATMEIDADADGVLQGSDGATGVVLPVGQVLGWILQPGEAMPSPGARLAASAGAHQPPADSAGLLRATPLARSMARSRGIDLLALQGSGPSGRVLARDLPGDGRQHTAGRPSAAPLHLHWFNRGAGVPLVLLHGFGTSSGSWRLLAEQLGDLPMLGIDLPNHGKSPRVDLANLDSMAAMLHARLEQEGIGSLHLVGHSMGGGAALALSSLLRQRLCSLTLLAPLGLGPHIDGAFVQGMLRATGEASLRPWLRLLFGDPSRLTSSFSASAWSELDSADGRAALAGMAQRLLPDGTQAELLRDRLSDLAVPVKLVWGALDTIVPATHAAGVPGSVALHLLPGVGHLPQVEAAPLLARLLRQQVAAGAALAGGQIAQAAGSQSTPAVGSGRQPQGRRA